MSVIAVSKQFIWYDNGLKVPVKRYLELNYQECYGCGKMSNNLLKDSESKEMFCQDCYDRADALYNQYRKGE